MRGLGKLALGASAFLAPLVAGVPLGGGERRDAAPPIDVVPGKYIITLKPGVQARDHLAWVGDVHERSVGKRDGTATGVEKTMAIAGSDFVAYSGGFDDATIDLIKGNPSVLEVEPDQVYTLSFIDDLENTSPNEPVLAKKSLIVQTGATWGLSAISHRSGSTTTGEYIYDSRAGVDTYAYVIDSGCQTSHNEFEGRFEPGYNALPQFPMGDSIGHGTHVAGTVLGKTYGVAKKATLVPVKVFEGRGGTLADVLDGITWSINDVTSKRRQARAVLNMSLGGGFSSALNNAVQTGFRRGVLSAVAAGNDNIDASWISPASAPDAITVGAVNSSLRRAWFSNFGSVLDVFAPGVGVLSAWIGSNSATRSISGTSMAAPHACGVLLYFQSVDNAGAASAVTNVFLSQTSNGVLVGNLQSGSPNKLAYNGNGN